jgi:hypothetical protein
VCCTTLDEFDDNHRQYHEDATMTSENDDDDDDSQDKFVAMTMTTMTMMMTTMSDTLAVAVMYKLAVDDTSVLLPVIDYISLLLDSQYDNKTKAMAVDNRKLPFVIDCNAMTVVVVVVVVMMMMVVVVVEVAAVAFVDHDADEDDDEDE